MSNELEDRHPFWEFNENGKKAEIVFLVPKLKTKRALSSLFQRKPIGSLETIRQISEQSFDFAIKPEPNSNIQYRLNVKRLPSEIINKKTDVTYSDGKVVITLIKKDPSVLWRPFVDRNLETAEDEA